MALLNRNELLAAAARRYEDVPVGERSLRIGTISAAGRDLFLQAVRDDASFSEFQARLVVATAVDDAGALVFAADDVESLRRLPAEVLNRLSDAAARLNGIGRYAQEEAEKNSGAAPSGDSRSGSPSPTASPSANCSNA